MSKTTNTTGDLTAEKVYEARARVVAALRASGASMRADGSREFFWELDRRGFVVLPIEDVLKWADMAGDIEGAELNRLIDTYGANPQTIPEQELPAYRSWLLATADG